MGAANGGDGGVRPKAEMVDGGGGWRGGLPCSAHSRNKYHTNLDVNGIEKNN